MQNNETNPYQLVSLFMSKARHPKDKTRPWHYKVAYHQKMELTLAFREISKFDGTYGICEFRRTPDDEAGWIPTVNDYLVLIVVDIRKFDISADLNFEDYIFEITQTNQTIYGIRTVFIGQLANKAEQDLVNHTLFIMAQDVITKGLNRNVRGFKRAMGALTGGREKNIAAKTIINNKLSETEIGAAMKSFFTTTSFIESRNTFETSRPDDEKAYFSAKPETNGFDVYRAMLQKNFLFGSYTFEGLSTVMNYNFSGKPIYNLQDYDNPRGTKNTLVASAIVARNQAVNIPISTRYITRVGQHNVESHYYFNLGGIDGNEVYEGPPIQLEQIFASEWADMMIMFSQNPDKETTEYVAKHKPEIEFELNKLAVYNVFRDIMQMSQIMAVTYGVPVFEDDNNLVMCHPGMRFNVSVNNDLTLRRSLPDAPDGTFEYIVNRVVYTEAVDQNGGSTGQLLANIYLVLVPSKLRELFNVNDEINRKDGGRSPEYKKKFEEATAFLRLDPLVKKAQEEIDKVDIDGFKQHLKQKGRNYYSTKDGNFAIKSLPCRVAEEFFTNINDYKTRYKEQLWLCGLADLDNFEEY